MNWTEVAGIVGKVAPILGGAMSGPVGAAVTVGGIIANAFGTEATPDAVAAAVASNPEAAVKLREIETTHKVELEKLQLEGERARLADLADARARDVAIVNAGRHNIRADVLAFLAVGGLVACVWFVARDTGLPERAVNAIMFVAGVLASCARDVYGFEFGSSRSSQVKDATIQNLTK